VPVLVGRGRFDGPTAATASASSGDVEAVMQSAERCAAAAVQRGEVPEHQGAHRSGDRQGLARILVLNRPHADERRDRLLMESGLPPRANEDRDEYPPAVGRGRANGNQKGLVRGINPIGWMADVMYVPDRENQSHGSSLGAKLRRFCNGMRFRYVFG
jgi:hypothetical protein